MIFGGRICILYGILYATGFVAYCSAVSLRNGNGCDLPSGGFLPVGERTEIIDGACKSCTCIGEDGGEPYLGCVSCNPPIVSVLPTIKLPTISRQKREQILESPQKASRVLRPGREQFLGEPNLANEIQRQSREQFLEEPNLATKLQRQSREQIGADPNLATKLQRREQFLDAPNIATVIQKRLNKNQQNLNIKRSNGSKRNQDYIYHY